MLPVYQDARLVALATLDQNYDIVSMQQLVTGAGSSALQLTPAYDDPSAELWIVDVPTKARVLLLRRGSDEQMAFLFRGNPPYFASLRPLADRLVPADEMMMALQQVINEKCRLLFVFWMC
jgi:hypothetical protein